MELVYTFVIAFFFSFIGSIPPGTLNLTIIQLGLEHKIEIVWRFAIAASIIEYPYAWIAIKFQSLISASPAINDNFELITAIVMLVLGSITLITANKPSKFSLRFQESGVRKGIILGLLNPLAIPYWLAMTAYIKSQQWIDLSTTIEIHIYLLGVVLGALLLLILLAYMAKKVVSQFQRNTILKKIPGVMLIALGLYALGRYIS